MSKKIPSNGDSFAEAFLARETEQYRKNLSWLKTSMPESFFIEVSEENILLVAHSLVGFDLQDYYSEINLRNAAIVLCLDSPDADRKIYKKYCKRGIQTMHTFLSTKPLPDSDLYLHVAVIFSGSLKEVESEKIQEYPFDRRFLNTINEHHKDVLLELVDKAANDDLMHTRLMRIPDEHPESENSLELFVTLKGASRFSTLGRILRKIENKKLICKSMSITFLNQDEPERTLVMLAHIQGQNGEKPWEIVDIESFTKELLLTRYFSMEDIFEETYLPYGEGMSIYFLRSAARFIHQVLVNQDPNMYTLANVSEALCYWPEIGINLYKLFRIKFDPLTLDKTAFDSLKQSIIELINCQDTGKELSDIRRKSVLQIAVAFIDSTVKTNFFVQNKGAFSYRVAPTFFDALSKELVQKAFPKAPFGVFFICNREFFGFQVRFQDLSRGGVRTVFLRDPDAATEEMPLIFLECYQLAYTQQKKNKDIPEGGAKGIIFLMPQEDLELEVKLHKKHDPDANAEVIKKEQFYPFLYRSQRLFVQNLLAQINVDDDGRLKEESIVDYLQKPEYLYIGPDENMHDQMIEWIAKYAIEVGYKPGGAFISSKPKIGINHKKYGVTSLGVNTCMEEVLKFLGIDPKKDRFTVKMAGGPDGDVAGNQIFNLYKYYRNTAKLLCLIDVSGVIYDPEGLDLTVCKDLFEKGLPIRMYPAEKLSYGGFLLDMFTEKKESVHIVEHLLLKKEDGDLERKWITASEAHYITRSFVHQTVADVFIPAGGRPRTLSRVNIRDFLTKEGMPTARVIIEGANLYLTQIARKMLEEKGTIIIKDSSANKGGVICSSFEVLASLSLTDEEFVENREAIIDEILQKIVDYARLEVQLLLRAYSENQKILSVVSEEVSERVDLYSDQIRDYLKRVTLSKNPKDPFVACFLEHSLPFLVDKYRDRLFEKIPDMHKKAIIASWIASKVVYYRGLSWAPSIVDVLPILCQDPRISSCLL